MNRLLFREGERNHSVAGKLAALRNHEHPVGMLRHIPHSLDAEMVISRKSKLLGITIHSDEELIHIELCRADAQDRNDQDLS